MTKTATQDRTTGSEPTIVDVIRCQKSVIRAIRAKGATGLCVFGSRARGDERSDSDLDIFLDYDPNGRFSLVELVAIERLLRQALDLEVHVTTRSSLSEQFRREVEYEAVRIF